MSTLKINVLTNKTDSGACELTNGATVGAGGQISVSGSVNVTESSRHKVMMLQM